MPKISIILPIYNGEIYLKETIDSVFKQSFGDFEIIAINDNSKDKSENIVTSYNDPRIRYIKNDHNLNIVGSRNLGLLKAQGDYICFLDHDDIYLHTDKLKIQSEFLDTHQDYGMIGSSTLLINENSEKIGEVIARTGNDNLKQHIIMSNQFTCGSVMFRKSLIEEIGLLDKTYNKSDDYDYWLKIGKISKVENVNLPLFGYRIHGNNTTFQGLNRYKMIWMGFQLARKYGKYYPNFYKQIIIRFLGGLTDFIIPNFLIRYLLKLLKNKI